MSVISVALLWLYLQFPNGSFILFHQQDDADAAHPHPSHPEGLLPIFTWRIPHSPNPSSCASFSTKLSNPTRAKFLLGLSLNIESPVRSLLTCHCPYFCTFREQSEGKNCPGHFRSPVPLYSIFIELMSEQENEWFSEWMNEWMLSPIPGMYTSH